MVGSKANLVAGEPDDTGDARPKHLDASAATQAKLFQPVDMVRLADKMTHVGRLTRGQSVQRNDIVRESYHSSLANAEGGCSGMENETHSH